MRQRLGLAVATLSDPQLLVLDEPTGGLDTEGLTVLWSILDEWRALGRMVMVSSHQLSLLERRVDRVSVFRSGNIVAAGTPEQLRALAGLRQRVTFRLAPGADRFCDDVAAMPGAQVEREHERLVAMVEPDDLLALLDLRARHRDAVVGLRIEEPTLDLAYEALLAREAA
jgi:ABC-2 type transport system ATP-binding protein